MAGSAMLPAMTHAGGNPTEDLASPPVQTRQYVPYSVREVAFPFVQPRMRMAPEFPAARKPPLLPQVINVTEPEPTPTPAPTPDPTPAPEEETAATMHFENPLVQAVEFFREAAKNEDASEGATFDPTFRPAVPDPQPASSATYQVTE